MRITHVISGLNPLLGGTAVAVTELARAQRNAGLEIAIVSSYRGEPSGVAPSLREAGIEVSEVGPVRPPFDTHPDLSPSLERAIGATDIVHIHALWEEIQHRAAGTSRKL